MPREWGKTLNSHMSEPKPTDGYDDTFWEHLNAAKLKEKAHRKYGQPEKLNAKTTTNYILTVASICAAAWAFWQVLRQFA